MRVAILEPSTNHWLHTATARCVGVRCVGRAQSRRIPASGVPTAAPRQATATGPR
jgi:hypothetical protein